jgi:hypothetical protein
MKNKIKLLVLIAIYLILIQCKKSTSATCGCDSPVVNSLSNVQGQLYFDSSKKQYYINTPGIEEVRNFICDTTSSSLKPFLDSAKKNSAAVIVSAQQRAFCVPDTITPLGKWYNINIMSLSY